MCKYLQSLHCDSILWRCVFVCVCVYLGTIDSSTNARPHSKRRTVAIAGSRFGWWGPPIRDSLVSITPRSPHSLQFFFLPDTRCFYLIYYPIHAIISSLNQELINTSHHGAGHRRTCPRCRARKDLQSAAPNPRLPRHNPVLSQRHKSCPR